MNETLELTAPNRTTLAVAAPVNVDQLDTAKPLAEIFQPYQATLEKWEMKAKSLVVTEIGQNAEMKMARVARLELRDARIEMDKTRKGLVENLNLRTGKINGTAKIIRDKLESLEALLLESEQFAERYAAKVKAELKAKREADLVPLLDAPLLGDLSDLSESDFLKTLNNAVMLRQAKIDAAAKAESDRKAKEESDREERERVAAENARLKAEAVEAARLAEIERQRIESERASERAKVKAEAEEAARIADIEVKRIQAERAAEKAKADAEFRRSQEAYAAERKKVEADRIAAESKARQQLAEIKAEKDELQRKHREETAHIESERITKEKEVKRAAAAPDKAKLKVFSVTVRSLEVPSLVNEALAGVIRERRESFAKWIESQIDAELL